MANEYTIDFGDAITPEELRRIVNDDVQKGRAFTYHARYTPALDTAPPVHTCELPPPKPPRRDFSHGENGRWLVRYIGPQAYVTFPGRIVQYHRWTISDSLQPEEAQPFANFWAVAKGYTKPMLYKEVDAEVERHLARLKKQEGAAAAYARAMELLVSHLDKQQADELERLGRFMVTAPDGGRWTLGPDYGMGVYAREAGKGDDLAGLRYYCAYASGCPAPDSVLMHKLMIESGRSEELVSVSCNH